LIGIPVKIPEEISKATFDLVFNWGWNKFPTRDIDMYIFDPAFNLATWDSVKYNSSERGTVYDQVPGE